MISYTIVLFHSISLFCLFWFIL